MLYLFLCPSSPWVSAEHSVLVVCPVAPETGNAVGLSACIHTGLATIPTILLHLFLLSTVPQAQSILGVCFHNRNPGSIKGHHKSNHEPPARPISWLHVNVLRNFLCTIWDCHLAKAAHLSFSSRSATVRPFIPYHCVFTLNMDNRYPWGLSS